MSYYLLGYPDFEFICRNYVINIRSALRMFNVNIILKVELITRYFYEYCVY